MNNDTGKKRFVNLKGIGNVFGSHSSSTIDFSLNLFSPTKITTTEGNVDLTVNPRFDTDTTPSFTIHPDAILPELSRNIGRQDELRHLSFLYAEMTQKKHGAFVCFASPPGYGGKALGRAFVDAIRQGGGHALLTRFWPLEDVVSATHRDTRWNLCFERYSDTLKYLPKYLLTPEYIPFLPLLFQIFEQFSHAEDDFLLNTPNKADKLPYFLRSFASPTKPLVILLEDFHNISNEWLKLLEFLLPELNRDLPILFVASMHSDTDLNELSDGEVLQQSLQFAYELAKAEQAELYQLQRLTIEDIENYVGKSDDEVVIKLHNFSGGIPLLTEDLWNEWQRTKTVYQSDTGWRFRKDSLWLSCSSGHDYYYSARLVFSYFFTLENDHQQACFIAIIAL